MWYNLHSLNGGNEIIQHYQELENHSHFDDDVFIGVTMLKNKLSTFSNTEKTHVTNQQFHF